ncbi:Bax inhibitor-1/YccA family protein [Luteococcus peritonei]|uniref:Bax inhibitor-1/YccA family protein n=1 Tax=Luteococcus peritonei TaxID=88874 RepID=A0ABW4RQW8_9ACTN
MANPILSRPDAFSQRAPQGYAPQPGYGYQQGYGAPQAGYGMPQQGYGVPQQAPQYTAEPTMTLDDVIAKTGITLLALMAVAAATFVAMPSGLIGMSLIVSGLVGFVTVMLVATRKKINPGLVLVYAAIEGIFIGAFSKMFAGIYQGIVPQAVLATFVAAGCTLAAYKFFNIRVTPKFRRMIFIGTAAFAGVMLVNFLLALAGVNLGLRFGTIGLVAALLGIGLAISNLIVDFDDIERGIAMGAPASESWRAAFGLTVTMVWLYTEILRLLSYFRQN